MSVGVGVGVSVGVGVGVGVSVGASVGVRRRHGGTWRIKDALDLYILGIDNQGYM